MEPSIERLIQHDHLSSFCRRGSERGEKEGEEEEAAAEEEENAVVIGEAPATTWPGPWMR